MNIYPNTEVSMQRFDLKGSFVGRRASQSSSVAKDLDLAESGVMLNFGKSRSLVLNTLRRDADFLRRHGEM